MSLCHPTPPGRRNWGRTPQIFPSLDPQRNLWAGGRGVPKCPCHLCVGKGRAEGWCRARGGPKVSFCPQGMVAAVGGCGGGPECPCPQKEGDAGGPLSLVPKKRQISLPRSSGEGGAGRGPPNIPRGCWRGPRGSSNIPDPGQRVLKHPPGKGAGVRRGSPKGRGDTG